MMSEIRRKIFLQHRRKCSFVQTENTSHKTIKFYQQHQSDEQQQNSRKEITFEIDKTDTTCQAQNQQDTNNYFIRSFQVLLLNFDVILL